MRDPYIEQQMKRLSDVYRMFCSTTGEQRKMWCDKWYQLVRHIATEITEQGQREAKKRQKSGR